MTGRRHRWLVCHQTRRVSAIVWGIGSSAQFCLFRLQNGLTQLAIVFADWHIITGANDVQFSANNRLQMEQTRESDTECNGSSATPTPASVWRIRSVMGNEPAADNTVGTPLPCRSQQWHSNGMLVMIIAVLLYLAVVICEQRSNERRLPVVKSNCKKSTVRVDASNVTRQSHSPGDRRQPACAEASRRVQHCER